MKRLTFVLSIILLVAAGCNKTQQPATQKSSSPQTNIPLQTRPNHGSPDNQQPTQPTSTEAVKQDYFISDSQKTGWKTYTNTVKNFSFDYPSSFKLSGGSGGDLAEEYAVKIDLKDTNSYAVMTVLMNVPSSGCGEIAVITGESSLQAQGIKITKTITKRTDAKTRCIVYSGFGNGIYMVGSMPQSNTSYEKTFDAIASSLNINIFANLPKGLQQQDLATNLTPTKGYIITTSILSRNGSKVVYSEISDCIKAANSYDISISDTCKNWKYNIFVKNLTSETVTKIYSYPEQTSWHKNFLIKQALAGGCTLIPFPLAWSKNDQKIILELGNPTSCGSGGYTRYLFFAINTDGGKLEDLAYGDGIFLDSYSKVVYTNLNPQKGICGTDGESVGEGIILKDVESGKANQLVGEPGVNYSIIKTNDQQNNLTYTVVKIKQATEGCFEPIPPVLTKNLPL